MSARHRPSRHYFLMRVAEFTDFKDPDVFSPHMDLIFLRKVYAEFQAALEHDPNFALQQRPVPARIPSTPYVVASRPERAARDLAKGLLVAENAKYEIRIEQRQPGHFVLRYRKSWKQLNEPWSAPTRMRRDLVRFTGAPYSNHVNEYTAVEIPSLAQERVFVQFFRLEPSFQFYEYAAVLLTTEDRQLRLPGWKGESVPFEHKLVVKSMFRPFLIKQGANSFVQSANSIRDAFKNASSKLNNNHVRITITDVFDRHRYTNDEGVVQFKLRKAPVVDQHFKRRADAKRKRTHCIEKTILFERGNLRHVIHTTFMDDEVFERELKSKLKHAVHKFLKMARSERLDARQKEASASDMLKNRWFLIACATLSDAPDVNAVLARALDALHARNPAVARTIDYEEFGHDDLFGLLYGLLENFDVEADEVPYEAFVHEIAKEDLVETLEERNLPVPPSAGCDGASTAQTQRGVAMKVTEGHDPFPTEFLSGSVTRSFGDFESHQTNYTRDFVLDTYVKNIRDDLKRIVKRNNNFVQYLEAISVEKEEEEENANGLHFGKQPSLFGRIIRALFGSLFG